MNQSIVYGIPGLGTDPRLFCYLSLDNPLKFLSWIEPLDLYEPLESYARRMAETIPPDSVPILIGVSFGGILAMEISRLRPVKHIFLISGIKHPAEKPLLARFFKHVPVYKLSKGKWRVKTLPYWAPFFGIKEPGEQALLVKMFSASTDTYRMWAIRQLAKWEGTAFESPVTHLHGSGDKVFPVRYIKDADIITGGTHYMIVQKAAEISSILNSQIANIYQDY